MQNQNQIPDSGSVLKKRGRPSKSRIEIEENEDLEVDEGKEKTGGYPDASRQPVRDFLEMWIKGNVGEADKYGSHKRAKELAARCMSDAKAVGLTIADMELNVSSVESMIYEMMHHGFDG